MVEFFSDKIWLVWILVSILCLIIELGSGDLFLLCFAIGALGGSLSAALGLNVVWRIVIFAICTVLSLAFVRPVALKLLHRHDQNRVSNADAIIGRTGVVSEDIPAGGYGRVALDGDDWKATADKAIAKGEKVKILSRESIIITVENL